MLPKASLPNAPATVLATAGADRLLQSTLSQPRSRERFFQVRPPQGKIMIPIRQRPDGMQMIGQQHDRADLERPARRRQGERITQTLYGTWVAEDASPPLGHERKEERPTRRERTSVIRHVRMIHGRLRFPRLVRPKKRGPHSGPYKNGTVRTHPVGSAVRTSFSDTQQGCWPYGLSLPSRYSVSVR